MTQIRKFDVVVFDWKGTLEAKGGAKDWQLNGAAPKVEEELIACGIAPEIARRFRGSWAEEYKNIKSSNKGASTPKGTSLETALRRIGVSDNDTIHKACQAYFKAYLELSRNGQKPRLMPGAESILDALQRAGIPMALARNTTLPADVFQKVLDEAGAGRFFHVSRNVVLSGEIGAEKPDRAIYEAVLTKLGLNNISDPKRIVFIGNELAVDIKGAKNMGWKSVFIRSTESSSHGEADFEIDSLDELHPILL